MSEAGNVTKTGKHDGEAQAAPAGGAGKPKKADAREMARERGRVKKAKTSKEPKPKREKVPAEPQVVFAFRLSPEQRDRIHAAAGPAKASRFVLGAALAAAGGDQKAFEALAAQARTNTTK